MDKSLIAFIGVGILFIGSLFLQPIDSAIPPTNAFSKIISGGQSINATSYSSNFIISALGSITNSINDNVITFKLVEKTCPIGQSFNSISSNGTLICG